ncbi:putative RNA-directed DNA polymerase, eukaryota, reverse transcriptase zinc-binding domain protein [Tanacetum coccineum]
MGGGQNKPNSHTLALTKEFSDHSPIILINSVNDYGPTPFRRSINATESAAAIELREKIDEIDRRAELSPLSATDVDVRMEKVKLLAEMEHRKLKDIRQKAKMKWDLEGDENFSFFHGIINNRRNRSRINGLAIEEPSHNRPSFSNNLFKQLTPDENLILESPITSQEIKNVVWDCGGEKAPGSDGFTFKLKKKHWNLLSDDIITYVNDFYHSALIPRGCNSSFITLVPKVDDPLTIRDFRPISLIGCQYKIIAKVLANRLSLVIHSVVGDVQIAFIKGWQITDGPLLVNEIISWAKKHKKKLLLLKVDFEKAFDSLSWSFLESIMAQMGFGEKWRKWIHSCLNSAFASVLINGSPTSEFKLERGLRQGDPLSPFLFILAVEALNVVFLEARNKSIFLGAEVGRDKVPISHLQFADDALIVGHWSLPNAKNLSIILTCFHLASGLKVNFSKSKLFDRFQKRLSNWKSKTLSYDGRLTLIKSVLGSLGVYLFSMFKAPVSIVKKLESIRRNFFWGGNSDTKKIAWIAWDKVISPHEQGGLGIGSLKIFNQAMLANWWWRFLLEENALWRKTIVFIHGTCGGLRMDSSSPYKSSPWFQIMRLKVSKWKYLHSNFDKSCMLMHVSISEYTLSS